MRAGGIGSQRWLVHCTPHSLFCEKRECAVHNTASEAKRRPRPPQRAEHPEARRNHAPQPKSAGPRSERPKERAAAAGGPTEPRARRRHCGGAAKQSPPQRARGEPPFPCQSATAHSTTYSIIGPRKPLSLVVEGPKPLQILYGYQSGA